ncbi:FadR/GntR family transcriptional regulator [Subtercola lobariae]|uniref:GntR family transcriptional regulator n=1 Tax=Subtercola lobariae TaxID=1588641 RepID=A0A917F107_9MICO|nr:FCD domain-containing protein [Subtercola lobariae]GGF37653.1 GntR family transcriptional regulator [Subtercola lobariae]
MTTTAPHTRAWQDVLAHIEQRLLDGSLLPGDHLPSERTLAADLGVGRSSVREALRVLEVLGLLRTHTGSGPESGAIIIARPSGGMSSLMRLQVAAQGFRVEDVVSTRLILETAVAGQLAEAVAGDRMPDLLPALEILDAMEVAPQPAEPPTPTEFLALDAQFHFSLAMATGNEVIAATMSGLRSSIESYSTAGVANLESWAATSARLMGEHRAIIAAIESGDPGAARASVEGHITQYYAEAGFGRPEHPFTPKGPHHG